MCVCSVCVCVGLNVYPFDSHPLDVSVGKRSIYCLDSQYGSD